MKYNSKIESVIELNGCGIMVYIWDNNEMDKYRK